MQTSLHHTISKTVSFLIATSLFLSATPASAGTFTGVYKRLCSAFSKFKKPTPAEIVFGEGLEEAQWQSKFGESTYTIVARTAVKELVKRTDWSQNQKVKFWKEMTVLIQTRVHPPFASNEFAGRDGSVVFQGSEEGIVLVITADGDIYRGNLSPPLPVFTEPRPTWEPDYTRLKRLTPKPVAERD